jgi:hypothetical protein
MALWPFRKFEAYIFRAGYTMNAASWPSWWPTRLPLAAGMILLCVWQSLVLIGALGLLCAALHLRVGDFFARWFVLSAGVCLAVINYVTLIANNQWRHLTSHIRGHSETDWMMMGLLLLFSAFGFGALLFWLLLPVIDK